MTKNTQAVIELEQNATKNQSDAVVEFNDPFPAYDGYKSKPARVINYLRATEQLGYSKGIKVLSLWRLLVLKGKPEEVFFPSYTKRLEELQIPEGVTTTQVEGFIKGIDQILKNSAFNQKQRFDEVTKLFDLKENAALKTMLLKALRMQYGRGALPLRENYGWSDIYETSFSNLAQAVDVSGEHFIAETLATLESALCYNGISLQQSAKDKQTFNLKLKQKDGTEIDLVTSQHNPKTHKVTFNISAEARKRPDLLDQAIHAMADLISSHRQSNNSNVVTPMWDRNINISLRLNAILLGQHHMHLNFTKEYIDKMDAETNKPGNEEQKAAWEIQKKFAHAYDAADNNKFLALPEGIAGLDLKKVPSGYYDGKFKVKNSRENQEKLDTYIQAEIYSKSIFTKSAATPAPAQEAPSPSLSR